MLRQGLIRHHPNHFLAYPMYHVMLNLPTQPLPLYQMQQEMPELTYLDPLISDPVRLEDPVRLSALPCSPLAVPSPFGVCPLD